MKKYLGHIIALIVAIFILTPPWDIGVTCQVNNLLWLWSVALAGFFAFLYMNTSAPLPIKLLVIYAFIGSFFSAAPYWSFMMTIPTVISAYFYLACRNIEDFEPVQKAVQSAFFLICSFLVVQFAVGRDTLYNFNRPEPMIIGTIGNPMISATLITCLAPFLLTYKKINIIPLCLIAIITHSAGMVAALAAGIAFYSIMKIKGIWMKSLITVIVIAVVCLSGAPQYAAKRFKDGRGPIWKRTIKLTMKRPIVGWGISSYQLVFPAMSHDLAVPLGTVNPGWEIENLKGNQVPALQAHNCWLQFWFELGTAGMILLLAFVVWLISLSFRTFRTDRTITAMTGLIILGVIMLFHFPTRLWYSVPVFLCYLAYYEILMKKEVLSCPDHRK